MHSICSQLHYLVNNNGSWVKNPASAKGRRARFVHAVNRLAIASRDQTQCEATSERNPLHTHTVTQLTLKGISHVNLPHRTECTGAHIWRRLPTQWAGTRVQYQLLAKAPALHWAPIWLKRPPRNSAIDTFLKHCFCFPRCSCITAACPTAVCSRITKRRLLNRTLPPNYLLPNYLLKNCYHVLSNRNSSLAEWNSVQ